MEPLTLRFVVTSEELARAMVQHLPGIQQRVNRQRVLAAAAAVGGVVWAFIEPTTGMFVVLFGVILLWSLGNGRLARQYAKVVDATPSYTAPTMLVADAAGMRTTTELSDSTTSWGFWQSATGTELGVAVVLRGGWGIQWIPSRAFATAEQQAAWVQMAAAGIAARQPANVS